MVYSGAWGKLIHEKYYIAPMVYSGAWGKLIHEKSL
jgi:hypothetical protein